MTRNGVLQLCVLSLCLTFCCQRHVQASRPPVTIIKAFCNGKTYEVEVEARDTFGEVCSALCGKNNMKVDRQSVTFHGKVMPKSKRILMSGVSRGDLIRIEPSVLQAKLGTRSSNSKLKSVKSSIGVKEDILRQKNALLDNFTELDLKMLKDKVGFLTSSPLKPEVLEELLGDSYFEDLLSDDSVLVWNSFNDQLLNVVTFPVQESMRQITLNNIDEIYPEISSQIKLFTKSPATFKSLVKAAMLQLKMMRGSTTTDPQSFALTSNKKKNANTIERLAEQIKFKDNDREKNKK